MRQGYHRPVATSVALWDDLLHGEELAHLGIGARPRGPDGAASGGAAPAAFARLLGVDSLYTHQAEAWEAAARGEHLIVTTGTASGKSLAFNLPVLDALAREPKQRAIYLYPTKALAQDQLRALGSVRPAAPARRDLRRRHRDEAALAGAQVVEPDPVQPGHAPHRRAPAPRPLGRRALEPRATWSWTRRTSTAGSSARTSRTSCGGCGGWRASTAPSRSSCSRRPRSPTRASWRAR